MSLLPHYKQKRSKKAKRMNLSEETIELIRGEITRCLVESSIRAANGEWAAVNALTNKISNLSWLLVTNVWDKIDVHPWDREE